MRSSMSNGVPPKTWPVKVPASFLFVAALNSHDVDRALCDVIKHGVVDERESGDWRRL